MKALWSFAVISLAVSPVALQAQGQSQAQESENVAERQYNEGRVSPQGTTAMRKKIADLEKQVTDLTNDLMELRSQNRGKDDDIAKLWEAIRKLATEEGNRYTPDLLGNAANDKVFRKELSRSVRGSLIVRNETRRYTKLRVNGNWWTIPPRGEWPIWVAFGPMKYHLRGEQPKEIDADDWSPIRDEETGAVTHHEFRIVIRVPKPEPIPTP